MRRLALIAALFASSAYAQTPIGKPSGGSAASFTASATSGNGLKLKTGVGVCWNTTTCSITAKAATNDLRLDVPTGGALKLYINNALEYTLDAATGLQIHNTALYVRATAYGQVYMTQSAYGGTTAYDMVANPTDGAGNTAFRMKATITGGSSALTAADLLQFNAGASANTKVALVDKDGRIQLNIAGAADGTCTSSERGKLTVFQAAGGAGDIVKACLKGTADSYAWRTVYTAP